MHSPVSQTDWKTPTYFQKEKVTMSEANNTSKPKKIKLSKNSIENIDDIITRFKTSTKNLIPVINEDLYKPIPNIKVIVATIKNPKDISKAVLTLNQKVPLPNLQHLKRVAKGEIIICLTDSLNGDTIEDFLKKKTCDVDIENVFKDFKEADVPSLPPKVKRQFNESNKIWPCNFHPNKYNEDLISGSFFNEKELKLHKKYMEIVLEVAKYYINDTNDENFDDINACIVVDPKIDSIVAVSFDNRLKHPIQHAAMLAIDNVAKTQNGGAWSLTEDVNINVIDRGIGKELLEELKKKYPNQSFGAKPFRSKRSITESESNDSTDLGPYLCTNYSVYLLREPCIMCAMALVHARARRVFFCLDNENHGGVKSKTMLQNVASLNHHFEVFTGFLE